MVAGVVATACTTDDDAVAGTTTTTLPAPSVLVRVGAEDWPDCLNPLTCADDALRDLVLRHVLPVAFEFDADGSYVASSLLARAPEPIELDDGRVEIRYEIAPESRWADGRPVTSSDFRGTWSAVVSTPGADTTRYDRIVGVDDTDPAVAVVTLDGPLIDWQELFGGATGFVLQADAFPSGTDISGAFADELPMAAGPYQLAEFDEDVAVLVATDVEDGDETPTVDQVRIDRVDLSDLSDPMTFDVLIPGEDDPADVPTGFIEQTFDTTRVLGVWFDQRTPVLASLQGRNIVAAVLDRAALAGAFGADDVVRCAGWVPDVGPWCDAAATDVRDPDLDLARFALAQEGWAIDEESGALVRGAEVFGVPVSFDPELDGAEVVAQRITDALADVAIRFETGPVASSVWNGPRPSEQSTGVGVFARDLGPTPRVDDLYGCQAGAGATVFGACPSTVTDPARALGGVSGDDARDLIASLGEAVDAETLWLPISRVPGRVFVADSVRRPESVPALSGPLGGLELLDIDE